MTVSKPKSAKRAAPGFRAIAWVVLLAFTLQSFVTQVHIHGAFSAGAPAVEKLAGGSSHSKAPAQNSTSDCPFCQAITHAGAFAAPSAPGLILQISFAETAAPLLIAVAAAIAPPHSWHSRAPPQA
jgi:hypothetical protein